jgi:hypothetical protein
MGMMRGDCRTEPPKLTAVPITAKDCHEEASLARNVRIVVLMVALMRSDLPGVV